MIQDIFVATDMINNNNNNNNNNADATQEDGAAPDPSSPQPRNLDQLHSYVNNTIFKSGYLLLSSRGIGWTSWKRRWFILTRTSLVFFKSDPNAVPQRVNEVNLTLGGIDLNNSGSVVIKEDKKLLTLLFRDGRTVTLKAESMEDLDEWKIALENALAQAPSPANVTGQNEQTESKDMSLDQWKDQPVKSKVIGQPILLALEDADGSPTFLEKGLRFIEEHGVKVEGILRQAADVADVERRVQEYEQGKVEFSAEEDAHVIADCVKHILRELPSSPVPASCCKALLEACRTERARRISAVRAAICETFPEPNRRLLQRILMMMQAVASHKAENRMSSSAVAACMAPLLLRALFVGECEIENDFDVGGDNDSIQLLQAAAAANHAQVIVITLLDEYDNLFGEARVSPDMYIDSDESETGSEGSDIESYDDDDDDDDDDDYDDDDDEDEDGDDDEPDESVEESDADEDDDLVSEASSKTGSPRECHVPTDRDHIHSSPKSSDITGDLKVNQVAPSISHEFKHEDVRNSENLNIPTITAYVEQSNKSSGVPTDETTVHHTNSINSTNAHCIKKSVTMYSAPAHDSRQLSKWGHTSARKNLSMESIEFPSEEAAGIGTFEDAKTELQNKFNQGQLPEEKNYCAIPDAGMKLPQGVGLTSIDDKAKADLEELALLEAELARLEKKVNDMRKRLNLQPKTNQDSALRVCNKPEKILNHETNLKNKSDTEVTASPQFGKSNKDGQLGAENDNERKQGSMSLPFNILPPQNSFKKFGIMKEVANPLTKLSFRLNFMKDKGRESAQSAQNPEKGKGSEFLQPLPSPNASRGTEYHSMSSIPEKGKGSELRQPISPPIKYRGPKLHYGPMPELGRGYDFRQPLPSPGRSRGSDFQYVSSPGKGRGQGSPFQIPDKCWLKDGPLFQVSDRMGKPSSQPAEHSENLSQQAQHLDKGKPEVNKPYNNVDKGKPEGNKPYNVDRGRPEANKPYNVDKGKSEGNKPYNVDKGR